MGTVRVLFCLLCGLVMGCGRGDSGGDLTSSRTKRRDLLRSHSSKISPRFASVEMTKKRNGILRIASAELGVKEVGQNDGKRVREYLSYTGIKTPAPWCASFVSFVFGKAGFTLPRTAWSPSMFPKDRLTREPKPADVIGIYFASLKRVGHVGLIEKMKGELIFSIEGNTTNSGNREGNAVCRRVRHIKTVSKVADWVR